MGHGAQMVKYIYSPSRALRSCVRTSRSCCLRTMRARIVSGLRLARRNDMVSRAPENTRSTATAQAVMYTVERMR